jgi:hypothetical protein
VPVTTPGSVDDGGSEVDRRPLRHVLDTAAQRRAAGLVTFAIGRRLGSPAIGLAAAWLVATSPAFLAMLVSPMSDVPASRSGPWRCISRCRREKV